jgi:fatty-acid desaturase
MQFMTRAHKISNLFGAVVHRSFMTFKPVEYAFATLGSMAVQGPVVAWVADHRKHHAHSGLLAWSHVASWKLDQASGWESRPGRRRSAG